MSAHKHTPGPWDFVTGRTLHHIETAHGHQAAAGIPVCSVPKSRKADARLIAAAPDSHEANRLFVSAANSIWRIEPHHDDDYIHDTLGYGLASAYLAARAAIAKATGESA